MIATVTLNPALDLCLDVETIHFSGVLRARGAVRLPGGKGLNVSRMLHRLGERTLAFVLVGGGTGQEFVALARRRGFEVVAHETHLPTRINVVVREDSLDRELKVNAAGERLDPAFLASFTRELEARAGEMRALVLAGSLPPGFSPTSYRDLVHFAHRLNIPVFVDTTGDPLGRAIPEKPTVVKINREELEEVLRRPVRTTADMAEAARQYHRNGIAAVCVTDGAREAVLCDDTGTVAVRPPLTTGVRTQAVGSGDSFLAGFVKKWLEGGHGEELLRHAIGAGTACAESGSPEDATPDQVEELAAEAERVDIAP